MTVNAVMESVPVLVAKVKASRLIIELSGATVLLEGLVPSAKVVFGVKTGVKGEPVKVLPAL